MALPLFLVAGILALQASASPTAVSPQAEALITHPPTRILAVDGSHAKDRRGILSDITSDLDTYVNSIISDLGSGIPSYVSNGLLPNLQGLPTGSAVQSSLGVKELRPCCFSHPGIEHPGLWKLDFCRAGTCVFMGNVFKQPNISDDTVDHLANFYLIDTSVADLPPSQQDQARNLTREIYVVQQGNESVTMDIVPGPSNGANGQPGGGGGVTPAGGQETIILPFRTTPEGDFDAFVPIDNTTLAVTIGTGESPPQRLNVYAQGTDTGNATSYLVSDEGLTGHFRHRRHPADYQNLPA